MSTDVDAPPVPATEAALLMIDLQNHFLHEKGGAAWAHGGLPPCMAAVVEPARRAIEAARAAGIPLIHTQNAWEPGYSDGGFLAEEIWPKIRAQFPQDRRSALQDGRHALVTGSWEAEFFEPVAPAPGEHVIRKNRYDAFIGTGLERLLTRLRVRTLLVGGVATSVCVESTVRDAAMRDYRVFLVGDAIGDVDHAAHDDGLARLARMYGHLVNADNLWDAWVPAVVPDPSRPPTEIEPGCTERMEDSCRLTSGTEIQQGQQGRSSV